VACPGPEAGLYIKSRNGQVVHVSLPQGSLGFQIGETSQIHTGGILQATPHAVRGCRGDTKISRESFAVFMEPEIDGAVDLPQGTTVEDVQRHTVHLPPTVRTLQSRWKPGMNFGEFSHATLAAFY
jgi:isopenicillin N synthase-like dioxygenase